MQEARKVSADDGTSSHNREVKVGNGHAIDRTIAVFPIAYADQNMRRTVVLKRAIRDGKVEPVCEEGNGVGRE
jgi:hypothetical protein